MTKNLVRYLPVALMAVLAVLMLVEPTFAQNNTGGANLGPDSYRSLRLPLFSNSDPDQFYLLLTRVINFILLLAGIVAFFYVLLGGFYYLTSGGDQAGAQKGRSMIANALIGIVIIFLSYALVNFFIRLLGRNSTGSGDISYIERSINDGI